MQFRVPSVELTEWSRRKRAIEDIEGSQGYELIMSRMLQEEEAANEDILKCTRWNWYRILKALIRRDCASTLRVYIAGVKRMGEQADAELKKRDPAAFKQAERVVFVGK